MKRKRSATAHEKRIRGFAIFLGSAAVLLVVLILWVLNKPSIPGH